MVSSAVAYNGWYAELPNVRGLDGLLFLVLIDEGFFLLKSQTFQQAMFHLFCQEYPI